MNLVDLVKGQMTPEVIGKLSGLVGEGEDKTRVATAAAVPSLLAAVSGVATSGGGAQKLMSALSGLDVGALSNAGKALTGGDPGSLLQTGSGLMGNLLGGGAQSGIVDAVAKFAGLGSGPAKNLIAYLLPMILGVIGGQAKSRGLDAQGLAGMLAEQKPNIASALPAGFSLPSIPGLDAGRSAARAVAGSIPAKAPDPMRWLLPAAALGALALLLWWGFSRSKPVTPVERDEVVPTVKRVEAPAEPAVSTPAVSAPAVSAATLDAGRAGQDLSGIFSSLTGALTGIHDGATAEAALPKLREIDGKLDGVKAARDALPEAGKGSLSELVMANIGALKEALAKVLAIPGVGDKLKPVTDQILAKLSAIGA